MIGLGKVLRRGSANWDWRNGDGEGKMLRWILVGGVVVVLVWGWMGRSVGFEGVRGVVVPLGAMDY